MKTSMPPTFMVGEVDAVKAAACRVTPGDVDPEELGRLIVRRDQMAGVKRKLLPIEEVAAAPVVEVVRDLESKVARLQRRQRIVEFSKGEYQIQDVEPLKWRRADTHMPVFGVFHPNVPNFGFVATVGRTSAGMEGLFDQLFSSRERKRLNVRVLPSLPDIVVDCYEDIIVLVNERAQATFRKAANVQTVETRLTVKFDGLLPDHIKQEMVRAARSKLFRTFFIIAEVDEWKWNTVVTSRRGDPILVGFDGEELWRLKVFDTTSAEQLMADEYSYRA